jgi:uncharacterized OB-fold protein
MEKNKIKKFGGTEISYDDIKAGRYSSIPYKARFSYSWDTGIAITRFLEELKKGKIVGRRCNRCKRTLVPPRMFCERDFIPTDEWVYVKDTGTVNTYSISHIAADASRLKKPLIVAVIDLDGASEGIGILHMIGDDVKPSEMNVGMKVKAVWKPRKQRTGSITDIRYFKPVAAVEE